MAKRRTIFLTGASGVLGEALLERLDGHRVICLVHNTPVERSHVQAVEGDVTEARLGLDRERYAEIARAVDCVVHAGAVTNFVAPMDQICRSNVAGTRNIVELARASEADLVHVSTAFVHADASFVSCKELSASAPGEPPKPYEGTRAYINSKRDGEAVVRDSGVPHVVVRPSIVLGDSESGEISEFQGLHVLAGLVVKGKLPMLPSDPEARIDFLPRDTVADAIGALLEAGRREGEYWITAGERAPTVEQALNAARRFAERLDGDPAMPRFMEPDSVDRLIRPVFLDKLPEKVAKRLELLFALMPLVNSDDPFPSSMPQLEAELGLAPPADLLEIFTRNLEYWASEQGLAGAPA
jgi:thioester reductase-like protein